MYLIAYKADRDGRHFSEYTFYDFDFWNYVNVYMFKKQKLGLGDSSVEKHMLSIY